MKHRLSGEERRKQILDAAGRLFAEKGFSGTRTKDIAREAKVSETLVFQHFSSKEDLFRAVIAEVFGQHPIEPEIKGSVVQRDDYGVFRTVAAHIMEHIGDPTVVKLLFFAALEGPQFAEGLRPQAQRHPALKEALSGYIQKRIDEGVFHSHDARISAHLFIQSVFMHVIERIIPVTGKSQALSSEKTVETLIEIYVNALKKP
jgi:AcrR family transcriptional regulator